MLSACFYSVPPPDSQVPLPYPEIYTYPHCCGSRKDTEWNTKDKNIALRGSSQVWFLSGSQSSIKAENLHMGNGVLK